MSNRDVAPRLRALDERVAKLDGGGMSKDLAQKAREIVDEVYGAEANGCPLYGEYFAVVLKALADVREADAQVAERWHESWQFKAKSGREHEWSRLMSRSIAEDIRRQGVNQHD